MGPRAGLDRRGKSRYTGIRSQDRLARSSVAIPTELPAHEQVSVLVNIIRFEA
jgi:hypothetical protein